jgi:hypothetical protein
MKTFDFVQVTISHDLKDPHSKALPAGRQGLWHLKFNVLAD